MTDDLFNNEVQPDGGGQEGQEGQPDPELAKWLEKDLETVAKAKVNSDRFIHQLQEELDGLRKELSTRLTLEEYLEKIERQNTTNPQGRNGEGNPPAVYDEEGAVNTMTNPGTVDQTNVQEAINKALSEREQEQRRKDNLGYVKQKATEALGPEYPYLFKKKAEEMGLDQTYLTQMAQEQPKAFLSLMLGQEYKKADPGTPPASSVSYEARSVITPNNKVKGLEDYEELRKADPRKYWSPAVQNEIHRLELAKARGEQ